MVHLTRDFELAAVVHRNRVYNPLSTDSCNEELAVVREAQRRYELELFLKGKTEDSVTELQVEVDALEEQLSAAKQRIVAQLERREVMKVEAEKRRIGK